MLEASSEYAGLATAEGELFDIGDYPGMTAARRANQCVTGEVFRITDPQIWTALDQYEGCGPDDPRPHEFERRIVNVRMCDGRTLRAWVYFYQRDTQGKSCIESGDYLQPR